MVRKLKSKTEETLSYEEHKKIHDFLLYFNQEGQEVFKLLRKAFGDKAYPVSNMAKAVNFLSAIPNYCETKSCHDRVGPHNYDSEEFIKWQMLYQGIGLWHTEGWE